MSPSNSDELAPTVGRRLEQLVVDLDVPAHVVAGVMAHRKWDEASVVTQDELQAAIDEVANIAIR